MLYRWRNNSIRIKRSSSKTHSIRNIRIISIDVDQTILVGSGSQMAVEFGRWTGLSHWIWGMMFQDWENLSRTLKTPKKTLLIRTGYTRAAIAPPQARALFLTHTLKRTIHSVQTELTRVACCIARTPPVRTDCTMLHRYRQLLYRLNLHILCHIPTVHILTLHHCSDKNMVMKPMRPHSLVLCLGRQEVVMIVSQCRSLTPSQLQLNVPHGLAQPRFQGNRRKTPRCHTPTCFRRSIHLSTQIKHHPRVLFPAPHLQHTCTLPHSSTLVSCCLCHRPRQLKTTIYILPHHPLALLA
jgi:hypothetical protein